MKDYPKIERDLMLAIINDADLKKQLKLLKSSVSGWSELCQVREVEVCIVAKRDKLWESIFQSEAALVMPVGEMIAFGPSDAAENRVAPWMVRSI